MKSLEPAFIEERIETLGIGSIEAGNGQFRGQSAPVGVIAENVPNRGILQDECDGLRGEFVADGNGDETRTENSEVGDQKFRPVGRQNRHGIALGVTTPQQPTCASAGEVVDFPMAEMAWFGPMAAIDQRQVVPTQFGIEQKAQVIGLHHGLKISLHQVFGGGEVPSANNTTTEK